MIVTALLDRNFNGALKKSKKKTLAKFEPCMGWRTFPNLYKVCKSLFSMKPSENLLFMGKQKSLWFA